MAHKRNPVAAVSILACTKRTPGLVATMLAAMEQELERAAGGWQAAGGAGRSPTCCASPAPPPPGRATCSRPRGPAARSRRGHLGAAGELIDRALGDPPPRRPRARRRAGPAARRLARHDAEDVGRPAAARLAPAARPLDHRGHDGSPAPTGPYEIEDLGRDVLELMDARGIARADYCGLSIGAMVGMWLGANAPERIDRLVLICTAAHMPPPELWQERAAAVLAAGSTEPVADAVVDRWLTPAFAAERPEVRANLRAMLTASSPAGYAWCCGAIERMDLRPDLARISAPTLVVSGSADLATPPDRQRAIADAIPGARHEILDPAAHVAAVEQPEALNRLILEHLR